MSYSRRSQPTGPAPTLSIRTDGRGRDCLRLVPVGGCELDELLVERQPFCPVEGHEDLVLWLAGQDDFKGDLAPFIDEHSLVVDLDTGCIVITGDDRVSC